MYYLCHFSLLACYGTQRNLQTHIYIIVESSFSRELFTSSVSQLTQEEGVMAKDRFKGMVDDFQNLP